MGLEAGHIVVIIAAFITLAGTYLTAKLAQRGQQQSTKVTEAAGLLKSQVDFIDRQAAELDGLRARLGDTETRLGTAETRCDALEDHVARCEGDLAQVREDNRALLATIATQINIEAERPWPTDQKPIGETP